MCVCKWLCVAQNTAPSACKSCAFVDAVARNSRIRHKYAAAASQIEFNLSNQIRRTSKNAFADKENSEGLVQFGPASKKHLVVTG